jgi:hypothetical protein
MMAETGLPLGALALTALWMLIVAAWCDDASASKRLSWLSKLGCLGSLLCSLVLLPVVFLVVIPAFAVTLTFKIFSRNHRQRVAAAAGLLPFICVLGTGWMEAASMTPLDKLSRAHLPSDRIYREAREKTPLGMSWSEMVSVLRSSSGVAAENASKLLAARARVASDGELADLLRVALSAPKTARLETLVANIAETQDQRNRESLREAKELEARKRRARGESKATPIPVMKP